MSALYQVYEANVEKVTEKLRVRENFDVIKKVLKIADGEVDLLIILCDTGNMQEYLEIEVPLIRECDIHNVPAATNVATAEALILSLERGDLDWRANDRSTSF